MRPRIGARVAPIRPVREAGLRPDGACGFPVNAALDAATAPVFWRPEIAPAVVIYLGLAPQNSPRAFTLAQFAAERRLAEDGLYLRWIMGLQLFLPAGADHTASMGVMLFDEDFPVRHATAEALYLALKTGVRPNARLSAQRRRRLKRMLRALDGRAADASYRDIAEHVLGADVADSETWRTSSARDVAIRLCRVATRLMRGGYLALLRKRS